MPSPTPSTVRTQSSHVQNEQTASGPCGTEIVCDGSSDCKTASAEVDAGKIGRSTWSLRQLFAAMTSKQQYVAGFVDDDEGTMAAKQALYLQVLASKGQEESLL